MIRTLHITAVLALALAGLVLVLCVTGAREADAPAELLAGPSAMERFKQAGHDTEEARDRVSPLVQQARTLALYLNPPPQKQTASAKRKEGTRPARVTAKPAASSPKFELHGISYHRREPSRSMALVWEPGGSRRWVRQGTQLGHLVIERINSGSVVYRDGQHSRELALASGIALAQYARDHRPKEQPRPRSLQEQQQLPPPPPPVRAIRQMPARRVAAKTGISILDMEVPGSSRTESK